MRLDTVLSVHSVRTDVSVARIPDPLRSLFCITGIVSELSDSQGGKRYRVFSSAARSKERCSKREILFRMHD